MHKLLALTESTIGEPLEGIGPLGLKGKSPEDAPGVFTNFMSTMVGLLTIIASIWIVFTIIIGAYGIMSAGSDKAKLEAAKGKLTSGIIGLVIVISAIFIVGLIGKLIGIPNILNPAELINQIVGGGVTNP